MLPSNWAAGAGFNAEGAGIDDRSTRGGPAFRSKSGGNVWYYVQSDSRKAVNGGWMGFYFRDETGSSAWRADPRIDMAADVVPGAQRAASGSRR